jgi:hypothetical protein
LQRAHGHAYNSPEKKSRINALHAAGLKGDLSFLPALLEVVADPPGHFYLYTALHALGRLGDSEAIPALDSALRAIDDWEAQHFVHAVKARIVAQVETAEFVGRQDQAEAWADGFLRALNITLADLNRGVAHYIDRNKHEMHAEINRETFALRELADQIYMQGDAALLRVVREQGIQFEVEPGSAIKVQLALLSPQQRVDWILTDFADCKALTGNGFYLMQLAVDAGQLARQAILAKLKEMSQDRERYAISIAGSSRTYYPGIGAMFRMLSAIADIQDVEVVAPYLTDPEQEIRYYAIQAYPYIESGVAWRARIGY